MSSATTKFAVNPGIDMVPHCNTVLNAKARRRYLSHYTTTLTLKWVLSGSARYATGRSIYAVDPGCCLLLNHGQTYDLDILPDTGTETLALFFEPRFVEEAAGAAMTTEGRLLDDPEVAPQGDEPYIERLYPVSGPIGATLRRIAAALRADPCGEGWLEDAFYRMAWALPTLNLQSRAEWTALPARHASTQRETYRRLVFARDFAYSCYWENLSVARIARVAYLSPFHFHRMFRRAFGVTPSHFVQSRRLDVARSLLQSTDRTVAEICHEVGFKSLGSFTTLYRGHFGVPPGRARAEAKAKFARSEKPPRRPRA
jgi:AraC-like DNA-binding protein